MNWTKYSTAERLQCVLDDFFRGGVSSAFTQALATKIDEVYHPDQTYQGSMKDGTAIHVRLINKGDIVPGFDKDGNRYEAWTIYWSWRDGTKAFDEGYVQIDRRVIELSQNRDALLNTAAREALEAAGVLTASLHRNGEPAF